MYKKIGDTDMENQDPTQKFAKNLLSAQEVGLTKVSPISDRDSDRKKRK
jgi:hypothetical protein